MFCHKCGTQLEDGQTFCHKCGTKVVLAQKPISEETVSNPAAAVTVEAAEPELPVVSSKQAEDLPNVAENDESKNAAAESEKTVAVPVNATAEPENASAEPTNGIICSSERAEALLDLAIAIEDIIRLKCPSCGAINGNNARFCHICGTKLNSTSPAEPVTPFVKPEVQPFVPPAVIPQSAREAPPQSSTVKGGNNVVMTNDICPYCGSNDSVSFTKNFKSEYNKNFGLSEACCGSIIFGPIGLLCGLCGREHTVTERNENWQKCNRCGKEFRTRSEASNQVSGLAVGTLCISVILVFLLSMQFWSGSPNIFTAVMILGLIGCWVWLFYRACTYDAYPIKSLYSELTIKRFLIAAAISTVAVLAFAGVLTKL